MLNPYARRRGGVPLSVTSPGAGRPTGQTTPTSHQAGSGGSYRNKDFDYIPAPAANALRGVT